MTSLRCADACHLVSRHVAEIAPLRVVPIEKILFRQQPDLIHDASPHHQRARRYRIRIYEIRHGAVLHPSEIISFCTEVIKIHRLTEILDDFRLFQMINLGTRHSAFGMGIQKCNQLPDRVLIQQGVVVHAHQILVSLFAHFAESRVEAARSAQILIIAQQCQPLGKLPPDLTRRTVRRGIVHDIEIEILIVLLQYGADAVADHVFLVVIADRNSYAFH